MATLSFNCCRNFLAGINVLYMIIGLVILGIAGYARGVAKFTNLAVFGALVAIGVILLLVAIVGFVAALKHHQILLFVLSLTNTIVGVVKYMIVMVVLFIVEFATSIAALALNASQQKALLENAWNALNKSDRATIQTSLKCCTFNSTVFNNTVCPSGACDDRTQCKNCYDTVKDSLAVSLKAGGGIGLFFSFTFFLAIYCAKQFRNIKDPRSNGNAFL